MPAAGGWVGCDIVGGRGARRASRVRRMPCASTMGLRGTNGEIVLGGADFALACACTPGRLRRRRNPLRHAAGPRRGGPSASVNAETGAVQLSIIAEAGVRGVVRLRADRAGRTPLVPLWLDLTAAPNSRIACRRQPASGKAKWGTGPGLSEDGKVAMGERPGEPDSGQRRRSSAGISRSLWAAGPWSALPSTGPSSPAIWAAS